MRVLFTHFSSATESWESMFTDAAAFATEVGPERLIGISNSRGDQRDCEKSAEARAALSPVRFPRVRLVSLPMEASMPLLTANTRAAQLAKFRC